MIGFAIVGMGHIARKHIEAIEATDDAKLIAICDTNSERLVDLPEGVRGYTDLDEMLSKEPDIHVVNICVPSGLHARLTEIVAKHKRHVLVEKPMALTVEDCKKMISDCELAGVKLSVVHPNRFRPAMKKLKSMMDDQQFGKLSHANATVRWNRNQAYYDQAEWRGTKAFDGGVLMNQAIHNLDLLLWLMGKVKSVSGMCSTRLRKIETEDVATALVTFESGAVGVIEAATTIYPKNLEESISVFGEAGSAKVAGATANWIDVWNFENLSPEVSEEIKKEIEADPYGVPGHTCIIQDMVDAIKNDRAPIINGEEGLRPVELIETILSSSEQKKQLEL